VENNWDKLHLLFVDDDILSLDLICSLTQQSMPAARIDKLTSAEDLLALTAPDRFDCIVIDFDLPGHDGMVCTQKLREKYPHLPIVLCTGAGDEALAARAIQSGVSDYIPKARISIEALRRTISNAIKLGQRARIIDEQRYELETFAFALAHDFKQPVRQIVTFSQLLREAVTMNNLNETARLLDFLSSAAMRLDGLVDVMSDYTLLNRAPEIGPVDVNRVIRDTLSSMSGYIEERKAKVTVNGILNISGNSDLLFQAIQNVIINGIKYNDSQNPIIIINLEYINDDNGVIYIRDNGIGIDIQYIDYIFLPLARLHTRKKYDGSGLGLTLSRKAVAAMNGSISCSSIPGEGTEFMIILSK
jgi:two-component system sensor histidine kinase/response regulator